MLTPITEEVNDDDHEASDQVTTEPHRSTRVRTAPEWYVLCLELALVFLEEERVMQQ